MNSKFGRAGGAGRAMRGLKDTGPPPLGRGMGALQPRLQSLGSGPVGLRGAGMAQRASGGLAKGRLGGRDHPGGVARSSSSSSAVSQDEKFQLQQFEVDAVRPFAMAIRLTPELLSDLKRAEAEGAACLMKFGFSPAGNGNGNVSGMCSVVVNFLVFTNNIIVLLGFSNSDILRLQYALCCESGYHAFSLLALHYVSCLVSHPPTYLLSCRFLPFSPSLPSLCSSG